MMDGFHDVSIPPPFSRDKPSTRGVPRKSLLRLDPCLINRMAQAFVHQRSADNEEALQRRLAVFRPFQNEIMLSK